MDTSASGHQLLVMYDPCDGGASSHVLLWSPRLALLRCVGKRGIRIMEIGEAIKNPAYRILQTEYSGCLDISAHA